MAEVPAFTATSPWKPPGYELATVYVALQEPAAGGGVVPGGWLVTGGVLFGGWLVPRPPFTGGTSAGLRMLSFWVLIEYQSSSAIPPVSPELGFQAQYVNDMPLAFRYDTSDVSHCTSSGLANVLPNSPTMIGATFCLEILPQYRSQMAGRLFGKVGSLNQGCRSNTEMPYSCGEYTSRLATLSCTGWAMAADSWPPHQSQFSSGSGMPSQAFATPPDRQLTPSTKTSQFGLVCSTALPMRCAPSRQSRAPPQPQQDPTPFGSVPSACGSLNRSAPMTVVLPA